MIQPPATSIRHSIVVEAPIEKAFQVFTEGFGRFKPPEHSILGGDIAETVFEPRVGGHVFDRGVDGRVCRWARVLAYEPPHRVVISWDISPHWQIEADHDKTSEVEVRFVPESATRTRVELESTATLNATARAGKLSAKGWMAKRAGRCTFAGTPICSTIGADRCQRHRRHAPNR